MMPVAITKTVAPASPVRVGDAVTYTLTFTNRGPDEATGVVITDTLPASVVATAVVSEGVTLLPQPGTRYAWRVLQAEPGEGGVITITGVVSEPLATAVVTNTATITAAGGDTAPLDNSSSAAFTVLDADLTLDKRVSDGTPREGAVVVYTLTITNTGPEAADGVIVSDTLPAGVTYVSDDGGGSYEAATGVWTVGGLGVEALASLRVTATLDAGTAGQVITNTAVVSDSSPIDLDASNDRGSAVVAVQAADAVIDTFTPAGGGTLSYVTGSGYTVTVEVGSGSVTETITLVLTPLDGPTYDTTPFAFAGHAFTLDAYLGATLLSGYVFGEPISVTIHYSDDDVAGFDEGMLLVCVLTPNGWEDAACGGYDRHPAENWLAVQICHLSEFSLLGRGRRVAVGGTTVADRLPFWVSPGFVVALMVLALMTALVVVVEKERRRGRRE